MTETWIVIPNWEKRQHYKTRDVPWIKLYTGLNRRDDWRELTLSERGLLCSLWVEYAASEGVLRLSDVSGRIGSWTRRRQFESLVIKGWIAFSSRQPSRQKLDAERTHARSRELEEENSKEFSSKERARRADAGNSASAPAKKKDAQQRAEQWIENVAGPELVGLSDEHLRYVFADEFKITDPDVIGALVRRVRDAHLADLAERQYEDELEAISEEVDF